MATVYSQIIQIQRQIARRRQIVQALRDDMAKMMAETPDTENARIIEHMVMMMNHVGLQQEIITGLERELDVYRLAGDNPKQLRLALRAVRRLNQALLALTKLHHNHKNGVPAKRMEKLMAEADAARDALAAVIPIGGQPPAEPPPPDNPPPPPQPTGTYLLTRDPRRLARDHHLEDMFDAFSCKVPHGSPPTPDILEPTYSVFREFRTADVVMPDGQVVEFWGFTGLDQPGVYPSKIVRIPQGSLFHGTMRPRKGTHTIHWHGIEPTAMNDGVGKLSFEVDDLYTYQWQAAEPGNYFYHCHHNTALHFEFGMVGPLIVDPPPPEGDPLEAQFNNLTRDPGGYTVGGPGYTLRANTGVFNVNNDEVQRYDVEAIWFVDDVDPRWHLQLHDDGLGCPFGEDAGHNVFEPKYFLLSGSPQGPTGFAKGILVHAGQKLLIRLTCGAYSVQVNSFRPADAGDVGLTVPAAGLPGTIVAMDARTLGHGPFVQYAQEIPLAPGQEFDLTAARRMDILFEPGDEHIGSHIFRAEFFHYVDPTGQRGPKHVGALGIDGINALITVLPGL